MTRHSRWTTITSISQTINSRGGRHSLLSRVRNRILNQIAFSFFRCYLRAFAFDRSSQHAESKQKSSRLYGLSSKARSTTLSSPSTQ